MKVWTVRLGLVPYEDARRLQREIDGAPRDGRIPDVLLLLEHPPVYTKGRRSTPDELPMGEDWYRRQGIDVVETDRGGRVTYHGPGPAGRLSDRRSLRRPLRDDDVHRVHPAHGAGDHQRRSATRAWRPKWSTG